MFSGRNERHWAHFASRVRDQGQRRAGADTRGRTLAREGGGDNRFHLAKIILKAPGHAQPIITAKAIAGLGCVCRLRGVCGARSRDIDLVGGQSAADRGDEQDGGKRGMLHGRDLIALWLTRDSLFGAERFPAKFDGEPLGFNGFTPGARRLELRRRSCESVCVACEGVGCGKLGFKRFDLG